jgi:hypothetical protein
LDLIVGLKTVGPDPSLGNPTKIYGQSIQVKPEVLKLLCPKGVTAPVRKEIMEASIDVVSLHGKFQTTAGITSDGSHIMNQFAEAVGDMTDTNARRGGSLPRDTQWRLSSRNAQDQLKTVDDLNSAAEELSGQFDNITSNMDSALKEILYNAGWTAEDSVSFCILGLLPRIIRASLTAFTELHLHFQQLESLNIPLIRMRGKEQVLHHARALGWIRCFALTRSQLVLQVYMYLRTRNPRASWTLSS